MLSHPKKEYQTHIDNISSSFDDKNHKICAKYHDIGKLSLEFQNYINPNINCNQKTTHSLESAYLYFCNTQKRENIDFLANFVTILKHHSYLPDILDFINNLNSKVDEIKIKKIEQIAKEANLNFIENKKVFEYFFNNLDFEDFDFQTIDNFFKIKSRFSKLILADKYEASLNESYKNLPNLTAKEVDNYIKKIESIIKSKKSNPYRDKIRETIFKNYEQNKSKKQFIIKAPTGAGKTLITLKLALKIAKENPKKRIITALPFTSIIEQSYLEYLNIIENRNLLKYHHLTSYQKSDKNNPIELNQSQRTLLADIWHYPFIVTTFNQLLYSILSNQNRDNLKFETIKDSVIIIDEIQNIPQILLDSIIQIFNYLSENYNITFIISSATMPKIGQGLENFAILSEDEFYKQKESRYKLTYKKEIDSIEKLSNEILKIKNSSIICVVNTIKKAKELYQEIKIKSNNLENLYLLTTHQIPIHRVEIIQEIKNKLAQNIKITLISTQLIEAGVDLDFDRGFREFSPFSSIIQIAGRVNREGKKEISELTITELLNNNSAPYTNINIQREEFENRLKIDIIESNILANIDRYFELISEQTNSQNLMKDIKKLNFQSVSKTLNENFMPEQEYKVSLFVEQFINHFDNFTEKTEILLNSSIEKFEKISKLKELDKEIGKYVIEIPLKKLTELGYNIDRKNKYSQNSDFGYFILPYEQNNYSKREGFKIDSPLFL